MNTTKPTRQSQIKRSWHVIDVKGKVLGRSASQIAQYLMGKDKSYFVRNLDCGDYVVVTNAKDVVVTGRKAEQKTYYRHSMYPGGLRAETFEDLIVRKPQDVIIHAVKGMLPQNKLRDQMLSRLKVFPGSEHGYEEKLKR